MQKCIQLDAKLKEMDNEIAVNPQYVQKVGLFLSLKAPITTAADDKFCNIFPNFQKK